MIDQPGSLPDYKQFMDDLNNGKVAKEFILHAIGLGYHIPELDPKLDIRSLPDEYVVSLAKSYWGVIFLNEYQGYGEMEH